MLEGENKIFKEDPDSSDSEKGKNKKGVSRRDFLKFAGSAVAASALNKEVFKDLARAAQQRIEAENKESLGLEELTERMYEVLDNWEEIQQKEGEIDKDHSVLTDISVEGADTDREKQEFENVLVAAFTQNGQEKFNAQWGGYIKNIAARAEEADQDVDYVLFPEKVENGEQSMVRIFRKDGMAANAYFEKEEKGEEEKKNLKEALQEAWDNMAQYDQNIPLKEDKK